jgi:hypothetical protein
MSFITRAGLVDLLAEEIPRIGNQLNSLLIRAVGVNVKFTDPEFEIMIAAIATFAKYISVLEKINNLGGTKDDEKRH